VVSGNVSLYNETEGKGIFPTPMIGMVGLMDDCAKNAGSGFVAAGHKVGLIGGAGAGHLGGSEFLKVVHGKTAGLPPPLDYPREKAAQKAVRECVRASAVKAAHDCSDGGLAVALAEMAIAGECGFTVTIGGALECFSESASRVVCAVDPLLAGQVLSRARAAGVTASEAGEARGDRLIADGAFDVPLADATRAWRDAIPNALGADTSMRS
jgi:phosphoribosylformylglycinamidine synthase